MFGLLTAGPFFPLFAGLSFTLATLRLVSFALAGKALLGLFKTVTTIPILVRLLSTLSALCLGGLALTFHNFPVPVTVAGLIFEDIALGILLLDGDAILRGRA